MAPTRDAQPCLNCGAPLRAGDKYCWQCGAGQVQQFPASRPARSPGVLGLLGAVVLIALGAVLTLLATAYVCDASYLGNSPTVGVGYAALALASCLAAGALLARRR